MTDRTLSLERIGHSYPTRSDVLSDVTLRVEAGEAVAVVGPSGAGKSTLFRIASGLATPSEGRVVLSGVAIRGAEAAAPRGSIGYIHQQYGIPHGLTVNEAVLGGEMHSWRLSRLLAVAALGPTTADTQRVDRVLASLGLAGRGAERVGQLSVGERQRVAVARTLLQAPQLVVADEPIASVDPATAELVLNALSAEATRGAVVLCSIHDLDRAVRHFPRIVGLSGGCIVFDGPAADLTDADVTRIYSAAA